MSNRVFFTALTLVASLATALVYGVGGLLAIGGTLSVGTLIALAALLGRLYGPLTALSNVRIDVMTALVSFERVFEVLDLPPLVTEKPGAAALPKGPLVRRAATTSGSATPAPTRSRWPRSSRSPSPTAAAARRCCTASRCAPSRASSSPSSARAAPARRRSRASSRGSTTRRRARSGSADHDVRDVTLESLHATVGVVTQEAHLFHDTIRANLAYARPGATEEEMLAAPARRPDLDLVDSLPEGLDTVVGDRGHRLSGGEKQRIALARLLLKAPGVVVLDEATAHLDSESEAAVQRALDGALAGRTAARHRAPALDGARRPTSSASSTTAGSSSRARTPSCSPAAASTPTSTAPSSPTSPGCPPGASGQRTAASGSRRRVSGRRFRASGSCRRRRRGRCRSRSSRRGRA